MNALHTAAVIGLGRIGAVYPSKDTLRTHTAAYIDNSKVNMIAAVDPDPVIRDKFRKQWGDDIKLFESIEKMLADGVYPDIVSICTNPEVLQSNVNDFTHYPPKVYFLEKPVFSTSLQNDRLLQMIGDIPTAINYHRCWDPKHQIFFKKLKGKKIYTVRILYAKGLLNYASHIIALLIRHFGPVDMVSKVTDDKIDNTLVDQSFSFVLHFKKGFKAIFQGFDEIKYDLLELDCITDSGIYSLKSGGCRQRYELPVENAFYPNYSSLVDSKIDTKDGQVEGLSQAVENIVNYLDKTTDKLQCDLKCGLEVFSIIKKVKKIHQIK